eukprot:2555503-Lingulodinium_polyedra.AAC.1
MATATLHAHVHARAPSGQTGTPARDLDRAWRFWSKRPNKIFPRWACRPPKPRLPARTAPLGCWAP